MTGTNTGQNLFFIHRAALEAAAAVHKRDDNLLRGLDPLLVRLQAWGLPNSVRWVLHTLQDRPAGLLRVRYMANHYLIMA